MDNYIGKTQVIPVRNIKLTVTEQKEDKLIIELDDGRYFRSDIEHWNQGFTKLNNLSEPLNIIGETAINKDGRKMTIVNVTDRFDIKSRIRLDVKFEDCGEIVKATYGAWQKRSVVAPAKVDSNFLKPVSDKVRESHNGEKIINSIGETVVIKDYINAQNVFVEVEGDIKKCCYSDFKNGAVKSNKVILEENAKKQKEKNLKDERIGERKMSSHCGMMEIVEYNSADDIVVKFLDDGTIKKASYKHFKDGKIESDYKKIQKENDRLERQKLLEQEAKEREMYRQQFVGQSRVLNCGKVITIVDFFSKSSVIVNVDGEEFNTTYEQFQNGFTLLDKMFCREAMVGNIVENNLGTKAKIIGFDRDNTTFSLMLDNGYKFTKGCYNVENGKFSTPYDKSYGGVGYLGEKYVPQDYPIIANIWHSLLDRVVVRKGRKEFKSYEDCSVCDRWLCFSYFVDDILEMWYDCNDRLELDKDIKVKGNKVYSPENCLLVPHKVNMLFQGWEGNGEHYTGMYLVSSSKNKGLWGVHPLGTKTDDGKCRTGVHKYFKTQDEAWEYYKRIKGEYVRKVLGEYEGAIPDYVKNFVLKRVEDMEKDD